MLIDADADADADTDTDPDRVLSRIRQPLRAAYSTVPDPRQR
jgi:hypothetical protein